jgi:hypothetical protein
MTFKAPVYLFSALLELNEKLSLECHILKILIHELNQNKFLFTLLVVTLHRRQ